MMKLQKIADIAKYVVSVFSDGRVFSSTHSQMNYHSKYLLMRSITNSELVELIKTNWTHFPEDAMPFVVQTLEDNKILRRIKKDEYKILLDRTIPRNHFHLGYVKARPPKTKEGVCPRCGNLVKYKNRHARSGTQHSGTDCSLNLVKSVMEL